MKSPFKFLDAYTKEDRDIFFGREKEIEELYHRVFDSRIMLVYGESGTGKSLLSSVVWQISSVTATGFR